MKHFSQRRGGFTLVEVIIVIAIIAIISSLGISSYMQARAESQLAGCVQNLRTIHAALEMYLVRHPAHADISVDMLVEGGYLKEALQCPASGTLCYSVTPTGKPGQQAPYGNYAIKCESKAHGRVGCDDGYPKLVTNGTIYYTK